MKKTTSSKNTISKPVITIPVELLPSELQSATAEHLANLITIGYKVITIKADTRSGESGKASAILGQIGEDTIRKIYEKIYFIENVSKQGRTGDILVRRKQADPNHPNRQALLVEIKNYSTSVGTSEIEKFYRDLTANAAIGGGIFISLNTKITGINTNLHFTQRGEMPIVFLSLDWLTNSNSQSTIDELVMLTADIIWAHLDARFVVDNQIFIKLSSKITKLNDCINGLSLNRVYITEMRQILDKQLTKIYETSYETEIGIRSIISSITRTLARGSSEAPQIRDSNMDNDVEITTHKYNYPDNYLDGFIKLVNTHFQNSLYNTNADHAELVNLAIETIYNTQEPGESSGCYELTLICTKKGIRFTSSNNKKLKSITVNLLKSRTDLQYLFNKNIVNCPNWASYDYGTITFPLETNSTSRETLADIKQTILANI
jgi:hypothetical protein